MRVSQGVRHTSGVAIDCPIKVRVSRENIELLFSLANENGFYSEPPTKGWQSSSVRNKSQIEKLVGALKRSLLTSDPKRLTRAIQEDIQNVIAVCEWATQNHDESIPYPLYISFV
jgi:hypothetical protein